MIAATSIRLFINLAQYNYGNQYYDLHNDYSCEKVSFEDGVLLVIFKSFINDKCLLLKFTDVKITNLSLFSVKGVESLTLDNLYRGRFEINGELIEVADDGKGYFYLEFYEGQKLGFWAKGMDIEQM